MPQWSAFNSAESTTVTLPAHVTGDLLLIFAGRDDSQVLPTIPTGWMNANGRSFSTTTKSFMCGWKLAASASETSGTWTSAGLLVSAVVSGATIQVVCGPNNSANNTASTTVTYGAVSANDATLGTNALRFNASSSYLVGAAFAKQKTAGIEAPPSGMVNLTSKTGATTKQIAIHETTTAVSSWASTNVTVGSAIDWITLMIELIDTGISKSAGGGVRKPNINGGADQ